MLILGLQRESLFVQTSQTMTTRAHSHKSSAYVLPHHNPDKLYVRRQRLKKQSTRSNLNVLSCCCNCTDSHRMQKASPSDEQTKRNATGPSPTEVNQLIHSTHGQNGHTNLTDENVNNLSEDWEQRNSGLVASRLRDIENKYEHRHRYKSIFQDTQLYQIYNEKVEQEESRRDVKRIIGARRALAHVTPGSESDPCNTLLFDDYSFKDIDADASDSDNIWPKNQLEFGKQREISHAKYMEALNFWKFATSRDGKGENLTNKSQNNLELYNDKTDYLPQEKMFPRRTQSNRSEEMHMFVNEVAGTGPNRVRWAEMPQVVESNLASNLSSQQRKLQEALFEIITSEASYYRTLSLLVDGFYKAPCMQPGQTGAVISHIEKHHLFSNILEIHLTCETFLIDMEAYFRQDPMLINLCEIIYMHSEYKFDTYVTYVQNQIYQLRTLAKLLSSTVFVEAIRSLQQQSKCGYLDLNSFLLLPMQRVTRLRLLVTTVLRYAIKGTSTYQTGLIALASIENLIAKCDAKKAYMEQKEHLVDLCRRFEYKFDVKALATESRTLVKEGDLRLLTSTNVQDSAFRRRFESIRSKKVVRASLFLFTDHLLITKKKSNNQLIVEGSCPLEFVKVEAKYTPDFCQVIKYYSSSIPEPPSSCVQFTVPPLKLFDKSATVDSQNSSSPSPTCRRNSNEQELVMFSFRVTMEDPVRVGTVYDFQVDSLSTRERWIDAIETGRYGMAEGIRTGILECPQVLITRSYSALEYDELELKEGDQASVLISLSDGWLKGALADGRMGWFPSNICIEVKDATLKRETMKNFMLTEEAKLTYAARKKRERFGDFPTMRQLQYANK